MTLKKWTIARRCVQVTVIALIASPLFGLTFFSGNLSAASLLGIDLADPLAFLQATLAGRIFVPSFLGAAAIIAALYLLLGGRTFCGWVCPVYLLTELGETVRRILGTGDRLYPLGGIRWMFGATLLLSLLTGIPVFEVLSPIGITSRAIMCASLGPLLVVVAILVAEIFVARRIWCRSLCPAGGFYSLLGRISPVRVAFDTERCTRCGECSNICPVEEVLVPSLADGTPRIASGHCTRCGACIDACQPLALTLTVAGTIGKTDSPR